MNLRVRVTNIRPVGFNIVVEFAPVLAYVPGKQYKADEHPKAHGGHDIRHDHRWAVTFPVAAEGMVPGKESFEEEIEEVGPDEVLRKRLVTKSRPAMVKGLIIDEATTKRVAALHPGMEYDVAGELDANSTFTPVVHP